MAGLTSVSRRTRHVTTVAHNSLITTLRNAMQKGFKNPLPLDAIRKRLSVIHSRKWEQAHEIHYTPKESPKFEHSQRHSMN